MKKVKLFQTYEAQQRIVQIDEQINFFTENNKIDIIDVKISDSNLNIKYGSQIALLIYEEKKH